MIPRKRRKWRLGRCQDCGWDKSTTVITFWATGFEYRVCASCIKPYRGVILKMPRVESIYPPPAATDAPLAPDAQGFLSTPDELSGKVSKA